MGDSLSGLPKDEINGNIARVTQRVLAGNGASSKRGAVDEDVLLRQELREELHHRRQRSGRLTTMEDCDFCEQLAAAEYALGGDRHCSVLVLISSPARSGHKDAAIQLYVEAENVRRELRVMSSSDGASLLVALGAAKGEQGDMAGAIRCFQEAKSIHERLGTIRTLDGAFVLANYGAAVGAAGDFDRAIKLLERSKTIRIEEDALFTPEGAFVLTNLGTAHVKKREWDRALEHLTQARSIRKYCHTYETIAGAMLMRQMAAVYGAIGDHERQEACEAEQFRIEGSQMTR